MREVTEMTQIKLLVVMPVPEDQRGVDASRAVSFSDEVNAILRFDGGWRLPNVFGFRSLMRRRCPCRRATSAFCASA